MEARLSTRSETQSPQSTTVSYERLCDEFVARGDARVSHKRGFGASALTIEGRIFAMQPRDRLVVKLPKARVDELVAGGYGRRFDAGKGRPMKEWLAIDPSHQDHWRPLALEALSFVGGASRRG